MKKMKKMVFGLMASMFLAPNVLAKCEDTNNDAILSIKHTDNKIVYCDKEFSESIQDGDVVTILKNVELKNDEYIMTKAEKKYTIDLNNKTISSTSSLGTMYIGKGTVELKNGTISHGAEKANSTLMVYDNSTVTVSNITITNDSSGAAIQIGSRGEENATNTLTIKNGSVITGKVFGVSLEATKDTDKAILKVEGGEITATAGLAISGNANTTKHGDITISSGKISSPKFAAIYQPYVGNLTITGGEISGKIGILARQGKINVSGGTIIGTASDDEKVGIGAEGRDLNPGTAIIVDNGTTNSYPDKSSVNITGGTFKATATKTIESYEDNTTDFVVTGGEYDKQFNNAFIQNNKAEVQVGSKYYVGKNAETVVKNAPAGTKVTVLQGNLNVANVGEGVTVENKGTGTVSVNGTTITKDNEYTIPETIKEEPKEEEKEKDYTIVENVIYEDNGDDIEIEGTIVTNTNDTYNKMLEEAKAHGYNEIFKMYEFHVKDNKQLTKPLTITFNLGTENNDKLAYILHQKHDGSYEKFESVVQNGKVSIIVKELSPFIVALKDKEVNVNDENTDIKDTITGSNNVQTASSDIIKYSIFTGITLIGIVVLIKNLKKEQESK